MGLYVLNDADVAFLRRLRLRESGDPRNDVPVTQYRPRPIVPKDLRTGTVYSPIAAAPSPSTASTGEVKFDSLDNRTKSFGKEDDEAVEVNNYLPISFGVGDRVILHIDRTAHETVSGEEGSGPKNVWVVIGAAESGPRRYGFGTLSFSGTDFHNTGPGLVNLLSDGIESVNSDAGSPVVTFQAVGMNYDRIVVQDTGIWTLHFHAGMQPYPSAATPPASFESKVMRVLATGTAIAEGAHIGNTDNVCGHEAFIRRSVWVLKETNFAAPSRDDSVLFARFSSIYTCGRRYDHDFDRSFSLYLEEGDELSVWHDVDLDEETSSAYADVPYQISLQLHYSDEPI